MLKNFNCRKLDGIEVEDTVCQVVEEVPLSIFINGRHFATAMISPEMRSEFVTGASLRREDCSRTGGDRVPGD